VKSKQILKYCRKTIQLIALPAIFFTSCASSIEAKPSFSQDVEQYIEEAMAAWRVPGVAIAVITPDADVIMNGYGVARYGALSMVDADTVFAIGSNGKSFTAVMLGALQDEGVLDLSKPIIDYLPSFRLRDNDANMRLTFEDALGHVSGLPEQSALGAWYLLGAEERDLLKVLSQVKPAAPLRERFAYNNAMFTVAAMAAQSATGKSYHALVSEHVLRPLNMRRSGTTLDVTRGRNKASPHVYVKGTPTPVPYHPVRGAAAAGSMNSTARDMSRYVQMMMQGGSLGDIEVLSSETSSQIQRLQHIFAEGEMTSIKQLLGALEVPGRVKGLGYGLGLAHLIYNGSEYYSHGGSIDGMTSWMMWSAEDQVGIVVLTNTGNMVFPALLSFAIVNTYIGLPLDDALGRMEPALEQIIARPSLPAIGVAVHASISNAALVGDYSNVNGSFRVREEGDDLKIVLGVTGYEGALKHYNGRFYLVEWDNAALAPLLLEAEISPTGIVAGLRETATNDQLLFLADQLFRRSEPEN
jgi:CubicO group peptidase (beta-lactamase class C family)